MLSRYTKPNTELVTNTDLLRKATTCRTHSESTLQTSRLKVLQMLPVLIMRSVRFPADAAVAHHVNRQWTHRSYDVLHQAGLLT